MFSSESAAAGGDALRLLSSDASQTKEREARPRRPFRHRYSVAMVVAAFGATAIVATHLGGGWGGAIRGFRAVASRAGILKQEMGDQTASGEEPSWKKRKASFLVIGDWGWDQDIHETITSRKCQQTIADAMHRRMQELGDVKFVINVGDSFYPAGVGGKDDPQWDEKWRNVYSADLRSVPWFSVYGNHDYQRDKCACSDKPEDCAQVNFDCLNHNYFCMPGTSYKMEIPDLGVEVIGLDLNKYDEGWDDERGPWEFEPSFCEHTICEEKCLGNINWRAQYAVALFKERMAHSKATNLLVFSHYPTDYLWMLPEMMQGLRNSSRRINYFGGHRHNVDQESTTSIFPNNNWLVGGGGGWGCDPKYRTKQGFVVGEIDHEDNVMTYAWLVAPEACCEHPVY